MPAFNDISGQRFGRLVAASVHRRGVANTQWLCHCDCGGETISTMQDLRKGHTRSCGCLMRERTAGMGRANRQHGLHKDTTYYIWSGAIQRCHNPKNKDFKRYGARGITVCERWRSFVNFLADMGERPEGMTLDREDNDLGYSKANCRWATPKQQANNRRSARRQRPPVPPNRPTA
jgi:hypothetical protein